VVAGIGERLDYNPIDGWHRSGEVVACVEYPSTGYRELVSLPNCAASSGYVTVLTGDGSDVVGPVNTTTSCDGLWVTTYNSSWSFGIYAKMGQGSDAFYGTENDDYGFSNNYVGSFWLGFYGQDDGAFDLLCGYGGDDVLHGDQDDSGDLECLSGAGGDDYCNGYGSSPEGDGERDCNQLYSATSANYSSSCYLFGSDLCSVIPTIP